MGTDKQLDDKVGRDTTLGSVGLQCARSEGATDTAFVRVMGSGTKSTKQIFCKALADGAPAVTLTITPLSGPAIVYTANVPGTASDVASQLIKAVSNDPASPVTLSADSSIPGSIIITAKTVGLANNGLKYELSQTDPNNQPQKGNLAGGADGPAAAEFQPILVAAEAAVKASVNITVQDADAGAGAVTVKVNAVTYSSTAPGDNTGVKAATTIEAAINADANAEVTATRNNAVLTLTAKTAGAAGNDISTQYMSAAAVKLSGGKDAIVEVKCDLKLVAAWEGIEGNNISWKFLPAAKANQVILQLFYSDPKTPVETWTLSFTAADLVNGNELFALRASTLVRGFFMGNIAVPKLPSAEAGKNTGFLAGASDGPAITDSDYLAALRVLAKNQANIIFAPGQTSDYIRAALLAQAENASILSGLRVAVLNAPRGLTVDGAPTAALGYDTTTGSAVMVAGWCTYAGQPSLQELSVSPDGFYAGHLAATPLHISPAARSSSPYFKTVIATDAPSFDESALMIFTDARLEAIIVDAATGGTHCMNGRTLSSNSAEYYICVRRMANKIKTEIWFSSQQLKSEPKGNVISAIGGMVSAYFKNLANTGVITSGQLTGIRKTATGVRADFEWGPVYPADEIDYGMHKLTDIGL